MFTSILLTDRIIGMSITYVKGDATEPVGPGQKAIVHICNNKGVWGAGFVMAISSKWREPEFSYRKWYNEKKSLELGTIQVVRVTPDIVVVNMVAQDGFGQGLTPPIRYEALETCLTKLNEHLTKDVTIHGPRFGAGLAGGVWSRIETIVQTVMPGRKVTIYDL